LPFAFCYLYPVTLSIIIVNYNVKLLLEACLNSVTQAIKNIEAEVIIVDNASSDNSTGYLQPIFPLFQFISNPVNEGFAKANNKAIVIAKGEYILFLNPDTVVPEDCFHKCISFMNSHESAGAAGVKMLNGKGEFLKESKRGFPSPMVSFWKMTGLTGMFPRSPVFSKYYLGDLDENRDHEVDVISGAFMMVKKEALRKTGGFDERFFMYAEDIDLSYRIKLAGYKNYYFAGTSIIHYKGASTKKDFKHVRLFYKAMSQFVKKYYGRGLYSMLLDAGIGIFTLFSSLRVFFSGRTSRRAALLLP
jgi:GT2 family glycosyltransferase